jgi:HNH endonuclease
MLQAIDFIETRSEKIPESGCWVWSKCLTEHGYGRGTLYRKNFLAHRLAYEIVHGAIPEGLCVLHKCDVRSCVNPDHLFLGTTADNSADMVSKDRQAKGKQNGAAKLSEAEVLSIRKRVESGESQASIAADFKVHQTLISMIHRKVKWGWL